MAPPAAGVPVQRPGVPNGTRRHMTARILDGVAVANQIRAEVAPQVAAFHAAAGRPPGLGIVLVGQNPASEIYVRGKLKSSGEAGLRADLERLPETATLSELLQVVDRLNRSDAHDGVLVQSPLPQPTAAAGEGGGGVFRPGTVGRPVQNRARLVACTPAGVIEMLERSSITIAGCHAVVLG